MNPSNFPAHPFITLSESNFELQVLRNNKPVVVEVSADWSGSCHIMAPVLESLAAKYDKRILFGKIDIDTQEEMATRLGVTELPFILFFKEGKLVDHLIGLVSKKNLSQVIDKLLPGTRSQ